MLLVLRLEKMEDFRWPFPEEPFRGMSRLGDEPKGASALNPFPENCCYSFASVPEVGFVAQTESLLFIAFHLYVGMQWAFKKT